MFNVLRFPKGLLLLCCLILISFNAFTQTTKVDELLGQLKDSNPDTTQINIMRKLSIAYSTLDPAKKYVYANKYRLLAEKNGIDTLVANGYLDMGNSHILRSNLDSGLYYFKLGHEKAKSIKYDSGIARGYNNIGYTYDRLDRKKESVDYYEKALKIYRKLNHKKGINQCITNLGSIYFDLQEYKTAHHYFIKVLENLKETPNDKPGFGTALYSLGGTYRRLSQPNKAMECYTKSLDIREKLGDLNGIALSNWGIGQLYVEKKEYKKAMPHLNIALKNNRLLQNLYQECAVLMTIAEAYIGLKNYKKAEKNADLALVRAKQSNSKIAISLSLDVLSDVYAAKKDFEAALKYKNDYALVNNSLESDKITKEIILKDLSRVNKDNQVLERDKQSVINKNTEYIAVIITISILLTIVIILMILYYKRNLEKKAFNSLLQNQKQEIADVNEELITQMNIVSSQNIELEKLNSVKNKFFSIVSHDLRSPLNNLKMLFELYHKGDVNEKELNSLLIKLEDTIYSTASFLDNLLEWSKSQLEGMNIKPENFKLHKIAEENITLVDSQIKAKSLKVENRISSELMAFADPNMINIVIRNLLSNAIKFCKNGDEISFDATIIADKIQLTISDTGTGIDPAIKNNLFNLSHQTSTGTSGEKGYQIGLILCKDMLLQNSGDIKVESELGKGTTFYISIPKSAY